MSNQNKNITIFMHIPKTAGNTLNFILKNECNKNIVLYDKIDKPLTKEIIIDTFAKNPNADCIIGHFGFKMWSTFGGSILPYLSISKPITYITMLRNPVDRIISEYFFLQRIYSKLDLKNPILNITLEDYIRKHGNLQTLFVTGGILNLELAKENINKYILAGITEMFNESIFLMSKRLGWKDIRYTNQNVSPNEYTISESVIKLIADYNELDIQLYDYVKNLLEQKVKVLDRPSKEELKQFLLQNKTDLTNK